MIKKVLLPLLKRRLLDGQLELMWILIKAVAQTIRKDILGIKKIGMNRRMIKNIKDRKNKYGKSVQSYSQYNPKENESCIWLSYKEVIATLKFQFFKGRL